MTKFYNDLDRVYKLAPRPLWICTHAEFLLSDKSERDVDLKFLHGIGESIHIMSERPPGVHDTFLMMSRSVLTA